MGEAHRCLYKVMEVHQKSQDAYGRFLSIVQSSGAGKSRMVDELSKEYLVIPINLRPANEQGEPTWTFSVKPGTYHLVLQDFQRQIRMSANSSTRALRSRRCITDMQPFSLLCFINS